jgi:hypothetical protein
MGSRSLPPLAGLLLGVGLVGGCAPPPAADAEPAAPLAWRYPGAAAPAVVDAEVLGAALQGAIDAAYTFNSDPILDGYGAVMTGGDATCPAHQNLGVFTYWFDDCTAGSGTRFYGYTFYQVPAGGGTENLALWGASTVTTAAGEVFHLGGRARRGGMADAGGEAWYSFVDGSFRWDGAEAAGTWLAAGYQVELELDAQRLADGIGSRHATLDGGVYGFAGPLPTVRFEDVALFAAGDRDPACTLEPSGALAARDADGQWYEIAFAGVGGPGEVAGADGCDGCGQVVFQGEPVYDVCLDFTPLVDWGEGAPW